MAIGALGSGLIHVVYGIVTSVVVARYYKHKMSPYRSDSLGAPGDMSNGNCNIMFLSNSGRPSCTTQVYCTYS